MKPWTTEGFIQTEFIDAHGAQFLEEMTEWVREGTVRYREASSMDWRMPRPPSWECSGERTSES